MSTNLPAGNLPAEAVADVEIGVGKWAETALTVLFTAAAVLFISFIAVVAGLV